jgi:hypothetical protein
MARGMVVLVVVLRAGRRWPCPVGHPCRGRGVPASPQRSGCSASDLGRIDAGDDLNCTILAGHVLTGRREKLSGGS